MLEQRYRLSHLLGQGGMAAVYLAEDTKLGKAVAVKVLGSDYALQPKVVQRFIQEARSISKVRHPNVVDVTDFGVTPDSSVYLVMELLHGEDLSATLQREGPMPWERLAPIVLQICAALAVVHQGGIVHRDIKPSNCFRVRVAGNPDFIKVLDFGIAKVLDGPAAPGAPQSTTGSLLGTPEYMAPELPRGLRPDARVDVYAVGVLMYKLLTGTAPFSGEMYMAVLAKHMFDPVEPPRQRAPARNIPEAAEAVILRALAKERDDRYPTMVALAEAIAATLPGQPSAALWLSASQESPITGRFAAGGTVVAPDQQPTPDLALDETTPKLGPRPRELASPPTRGLRRLRTFTAALGAVALAVVVCSLVRRGEQPVAPAEAHAPSGLTQRVGAEGPTGAAARSSGAAGARGPLGMAAGTGPEGQVGMAAGTGPGGQAAVGTGPEGGQVAVETVPEGQLPANGAGARDGPVAGHGPKGGERRRTDDEVGGTRRRADEEVPPLLDRPPLDRARAEATLAGLGPQIRACARGGGLSGNLALTVEIDKLGRVTRVAAGSELPDATFECVRNVVMAQRFTPSREGGALAQTFPLSG